MKNELEKILAILFILSEILAQIKSIQANSITQLVINLFKSIFKKWK